jgi:hypothetical protein
MLHGDGDDSPEAATGDAFTATSPFTLTSTFRGL